MMRRITIRQIVSKAAVVITFFSICAGAWGHGGVSVDDDLCMMRIGTFKAHFTGYQPESRATQEFCEDIPVVSKAIFVIDIIDDELRKMNMDFRVLKDVKEIGVKATLADLGTKADIEAATEFYKEAKIFPRGTMPITVDFTEEGKYIGLVTAVNPETGREYTSVFPFSVGVVNYSSYAVPIVLILMLTIVFFGIFLYKWKKQEQEAGEEA